MARAEERRASAALDDLALLRRYEPVLHFTRGEEFLPIDVDWYLRQCSLWVSLPGGQQELLLDEGEVTAETLARPRAAPPGAVHYLVFSGPLNLAELSAFYVRERVKHLRDPANHFRAAIGRLARVGYGSRLVDALFSLTLLLRGRMPGDTAAAAILTCRRRRAGGQDHVYYGRVVRENGWVALQYFFFYSYNNWRSGFYGANDHEGDWEMIVVYLYEAEEGELAPAWVVYAAHDYGGDDLRRAWDDVEMVERLDTHPVVYVGAGSHASYFQPGEYLAEIEVPYLQPVVRLVDRLTEFWVHLLRQNGGGRTPRLPILRMPFVDYARGDGVSIGPTTGEPWTPVLLDPLPGWVSQYRGLWGYYARDPAAGENAPAGPMYNRDGTVRRRWYDPIGWAGLDKLPTPAQERAVLDRRLVALRERQSALEGQIRASAAELQELGVEQLALRDNAHLVARLAAVESELRAARLEVNALRREHAENVTLLEALARRRAALDRRGDALGAPVAPRRHHQPEQSSAADLRLSRWLELWAAGSVSLLLVAVVLLLVGARQYVVVGLGALLGTFVLVEAVFRRQLAGLISFITTALALISAAVLVKDFFWPMLAAGTVLVGLYLLWENVMELRG